MVIDAGNNVRESICSNSCFLHSHPKFNKFSITIAEIS